ncbi:hypothetical protein JCM5353_003899 [Sporobolomyces roseus]
MSSEKQLDPTSTLQSHTPPTTAGGDTSTPIDSYQYTTSTLTLLIAFFFGVIDSLTRFIQIPLSSFLNNAALAVRPRKPKSEPFDLESYLEPSAYLAFVQQSTSSSTNADTPLFAFPAVPSSTDEYVLDSGATRHFTTIREHLTDYRPYDKPIKINGVFGSAGEALGEGTLTLAGNSASGIKLMRVMYAPKLGVNLVSQTRMMLAGFRFTNNTRILSIYDRSFAHLLDIAVSPSIRMKSNTPSTPSPLPLVAHRVSTDELWIWHERLGHPSDDRLKSVLGQWNGDEKVSSVCEECIRAKATRVSANKVSSDRATRNLERVSADTWGPSPVRGVKGERFAVVMVDGCSRYAWVETLTGKGGIGDIIKSRIQQEEQMHGVKVAQFQSDNGTEFVNHNLDRFLKSNGIQHRTSVVHSHGQNGFIENRWRTSIETTRALLSSSGMPPTFWPYALSAAVYLYNRTPSKVLDYETPYERYYGKKPELNHLKVWGCEAWLALPREGVYRVNKLQSRAVKGRFVGYPNDKKGWMFWVPEWRKIVIWHEIARWNESGKGNEGVEGDLKYDEWMKELDEDRVWLREGRERGVVPEGGNNGTERQELVNETPDSRPPPPPPPPPAPANDAPPPPVPAAAPHEPSPAPEPNLPPPPQNPVPALPAPAPAPAPPQRRSNRLAGASPSHYVPLEGAPVEAALRAVIPQQTPSPTSPLAYAILDPDLDNDEEYIVAATVTADPDASPEELKLAIASALATSPTWTGDHDSPQYWEIRNRPDVDLWLAAMALELAAFSATGTWDEELVELPKGRKAIAVKWVLLIKRDAEGKIIKYKARLVARGDQQIDGVDYDETHSSTVRLASVRFLFALLAAFPHYKLSQFDISNAYLLGNLDREIYVQQPLGFSDKSKPTLVRRLRKALYGLKQGGREWQKVLRDALEKIGFKRCEADHGVYVRKRGGKSVYIPTHVDDGLVVGDDNLEEMLDELDKQLGGKLKKIETGLFLGMKFRRKEDGTVEVDQAHYVRSILERFFPNGLNPVVTPLDASYSNLAAATEEERFDCPYRELLGALLYLSTCTRPDLTFSLSFLGRFAACPAKRHWTALVHVCRYLEGTRDLGLRYITPTLPFTASLLTAWCDADHGADKDTRRSVSGYVFSIGDDGLRSTAISWLSKRQKSVAISSTEAEYMALSEAAREALWLRHLLRELGFDTSLPTLIRGDNSGSLILASHPTSHSRTKHIDVHYHFTRERVSDGTVELKWVRTDDMVADVFTKGLGREKHVLFTSLVGLRNLRRKGGCEKG